MKTYIKLIEGAKLTPKEKKAVSDLHTELVNQDLEQTKLLGKDYELKELRVDAIYKAKQEIKITFKIESPTGASMSDFKKKFDSISNVKSVMSESDHKKLFRPETALYNTTSAWFTVNRKY